MSIQTRLPRAFFEVALEKRRSADGAHFELGLNWLGGPYRWRWKRIEGKTRPAVLRRVPGALVEMLAELAEKELDEVARHQRSADMLQQLAADELERIEKG